MRNLRTLMIGTALLAALMASADCVFLELIGLGVGAVVMWLTLTSYALKALDRHEKAHSLEDDWGPKGSGPFLLMVCTPIALIPVTILLVYLLAALGFEALRALKWALHSWFPR